MARNASHNDGAWRTLERAYKRVHAALDAGFKQAALPGLDVFSALRILRDTPQDLTAKQLETLLLMPQYGVSRLLDRMDREKLIKRIARPNDQRSKTVQITKKGMACLADQTHVYNEVLDTFLADKAKPGQLTRLADMLALLDRDGT